LILRKTIKTVVTRCQILRLKCTKIDFGWGSAPDPNGELTALPRPLAGTRGPTSKGRGREKGKKEWMDRKERKKRRGGEKNEEKGRLAIPKLACFISGLN